MTPLNPRENYDRIVASCAQNLRNFGYARRGSSLRKVIGGNVAIIQFQKSGKSDADTVLFTVNLGIVCTKLLEDERSSPKEVGILYAHLSQRVGMFLPGYPDKWWTIESRTDADSLVEEVLSLIEREAVPYLDRYLDDDALLALWESGESPGRTETQRVEYLAALKAMKASPP